MRTKSLMEIIMDHDLFSITGIKDLSVVFFDDEKIKNAIIYSSSSHKSTIEAHESNLKDCIKILPENEAKRFCNYFFKKNNKNVITVDSNNCGCYIEYANDNKQSSPKTTSIIAEYDDKNKARVVISDESISYFIDDNNTLQENTPDFSIFDIMRDYNLMENGSIPNDNHSIDNDFNM